MHPSSADPAAPAAQRFDPPDSATRPGGHLGLVWRGLGTADVEAVAELWARSDSVDEPAEPTGPSAVRNLLSAARTSGDTLGGVDEHGRLRAAAAIVLEQHDATVQARLRATIDPDLRGRGIGKALLTWQEGRARQLLAEAAPSGPARIVVDVDVHQVDRRRLYAAAGFAPSVDAGELASSRDAAGLGSFQGAGELASSQDAPGRTFAVRL